MTEAADTHRCRVCDADVPARDVCVKDGYRYVQCAGCGVVRQFPYPTAEETARWYERYAERKSARSEYLTRAGYAPFVRDKQFTFRDLRLTPEAFAGKRLCDVGCATGQFVRMMGDQGLARVVGVDIGEEGIRIAQAEGLNCVQGDFLEMTDRFDVVSMFHLIEHLRRPRAFIEHAYRVLDPGGWLLLETPCVGPVAEAFGEHWRFFMPVEHINLFTQDALFRMCRDAGFTLRTWVTFGSGNDTGAVPPANKRAMDAMAKRLGVGDVIAAWFVK